MQCLKCGSRDFIKIKDKLFCTRCGLVIKELDRGEEAEETSKGIVPVAKPKVVESEEFTVRPSAVLVKRTPLELPKKSKKRIKDVNFKPFCFVATILSIIFFVILLFVFEPFINFRSLVVKYTQPVSEIEHFKNKMELASEKAQATWNTRAYLVFVNLSENSDYKPVNFSTRNTYHCIFEAPSEKNKVAIFFVHKNRDEIVGEIKTSKKDINISCEDYKNPPSINLEKVSFLADEVFPIVEVNGLTKFLKKYKKAKLKTGPVLEYSRKYNTAYWLYIYETSDKKHKFMSKVNAQNGKILELSQR